MASEGSKKICITSKRFAETRSPACEHCSNAHQSSFCQFLLPLATTTTTTTGAPPTVGHHDWSEKNYKRESFINLLNHQVETIEMIWLIGCIIAKLYHGPDITSMSWSLSGSMFWTIGSLRLIFFGISFSLYNSEARSPSLLWNNVLWTQFLFNQMQPIRCLLNKTKYTRLLCSPDSVSTCKGKGKQDLNKGLFTYYVSQNLDPPSPLRQQ